MLALWIALALLISGPAAASMPPPNKAHAQGSSRGVGGVYALPFGHVSKPSRTGAYYIPQHRPETGRPLLILFHGFKDNGAHIVSMFRAAADTYGIALVAPDSLDDAWGVGKAGVATPDLVHATDALYWFKQRVGAVDSRHVGAGGHSYGCRMAAYFATAEPQCDSVFLSHGRFLPVSLGPVQVAAWFSGSPRDTQFRFSVTQAQWHSWPRGPSELRTYGCPSCGHAPQAAELDDIARWHALRQ